jgi:hypothetical protein
MLVVGVSSFGRIGLRCELCESQVAKSSVLSVLMRFCDSRPYLTSISEYEISGSFQPNDVSLKISVCGKF